MKKIIISSLIGLVITLVIVVAVLTSFSGSSVDDEAYLKNELEKTNYCEVKEDCIRVGNICPFGCHLYANRNEADRIKILVTSFPLKCIYDCLSCPEVECVGHKCEATCNS